MPSSEQSVRANAVGLLNGGVGEFAQHEMMHGSLGRRLGRVFLVGSLVGASVGASVGTAVGVIHGRDLRSEWDVGHHHSTTNYSIELLKFKIT